MRRVPGGRFCERCERRVVDFRVMTEPEALIVASLFAPGYTMASLIANEFSEASDDLHLSALMAVGLTLLVLALVVNGIARWLVWRVARRAGGLP